MVGAEALDPNWVGQAPKDLGREGLSTWQTILSRHEKVRRDLVVDEFDEGVKVLGLTPDRLPNLAEINKVLLKLTGFRGVFVEGLEEGKSFYKMLSERIFPVGNFIRDQRDLNYTPAPDIVHDLYGHLPFFVDQRYADFCQKFGELTCEFADQPEKLRQFERFFWFTIEFGLIKTAKGVRVFGAGIASSIAECQYALSGEPEVLPFDIDVIRRQEFRIDQMQKRLFLLENVEQLYASLPELYRRVKAE